MLHLGMKLMDDFHIEHIIRNSSCCMMKLQLYFYINPKFSHYLPNVHT